MQSRVTSAASAASSISSVPAGRNDIAQSRYRSIEQCLLLEKIVVGVGGETELRKDDHESACLVCCAGQLERRGDVERDV